MKKILSQPFKIYFFFLSLLWTALIMGMMVWEYYDQKEHINDIALIEARTILETNLAYRRWNALLHGGVYVPVAKKNQPNPDPPDIPGKKITTTDNLKLALVDHEWMTREVFDLLKGRISLPPLNRAVSLKYVNSLNKPDEWEEQALQKIIKGYKEVSGVADINNEFYMRLIKPIAFEKECLKCHKGMGYKEGDIKGGVSVAVPMKKYMEDFKKHQIKDFAGYSFLWIVGFAGILLFLKKIDAPQQSLKGSESRFRMLSQEFNALLDAIPDTIVLISPDMKVIWANKGASIGINLDISNIIGEFCYKLWHARSTPCDICPVSKSYETGNPENVVVNSPDGRIWELRTVPIKDEGGKVIKVLEVARDITEHRKLESQLHQSQKMEAVGMLTGGIAHDFNNILTTIIGYATLLNMKIKNDDPFRANIDQILTSSERAASLTQSLLAFSRKQIINPKPVNLNEIVKKVEKLLSRLIGEDIELRTFYSESDIIVMADSGQIEQVLVNLVTNARDAMPDGGNLTIITELAMIDSEFVKVHGFGEPGSYALLSVTDTGIGMDEKTKEKIFEPFFTTKEAGKGTGLGLSMVYGIIKQHDGYINCYSEPGKGTTFKIYIKIVKTKAEENGGEQLIRHLKGGAETVLLADDDEGVRQTTKSVLEEFGYTIITAVDGDDAVKQFIQNKDKIQLLIFDVVMPKKSGREAYEEIKNIQPSIKILFTSGYAPSTVSKKGVTGGEFDFISKPVSPVELLKKVRESLDSKKHKTA